MARQAATGSKRRFALVGGSAFVLGVAMIEGLTALGLSAYVAQFPTFLGGATYTWWLNRRMTFAVAERPTWAEYFRYLSGSAGGLALGMALFSVLVWFGLPAMAALAGGSIAGLAFNYFSYSRFAFAKPASR